MPDVHQLLKGANLSSNAAVPSAMFALNGSSPPPSAPQAGHQGAGIEKQQWRSPSYSSCPLTSLHGNVPALPPRAHAMAAELAPHTCRQGPVSPRPQLPCVLKYIPMVLSTASQTPLAQSFLHRGVSQEPSRKAAAAAAATLHFTRASRFARWFAPPTLYLRARVCVCACTHCAIEYGGLCCL